MKTSIFNMTFTLPPMVEMTVAFGTFDGCVVSFGYACR